jgi:colanic acid biosynthesis glycosyl transferase WcaI
MNILVVSQYFWPENFRINDWVNGMLARGHSVTVLTGKPNYPSGNVFEDYKNNNAEFNDYGEAKIIRVPMIARGQKKWRLLLNYLSFSLSASSIGLWKLRRQKFDASFVFGASPITVAIPALIQKKIKGTPTVLWVLDLWPESLRAAGVVRSKNVLAILSKGVAFLYAKSDAVLGQSQAFVSAIKNLVPKHKNVGYAPNWSDQFLSVGESKIAPEIECDKNKFTLLFTGNVGEAQDFPTIINAAEILKESPIRIIIIGSGRKLEWLANEVKRRHLTDTVILLGSFPLERMPSFYALADAFLVTLVADETIEKTVPGKIHAYMAYGKPIVGAVNGEAAKVLADARCGYVSPASCAEKLADNILALSHASKTDWESMGLNAQAFYAQEFEREKVLDAFEAHLYLTAKLD